LFFKLAPVTCEDLVYDLGCGDGRLLIAAVEAGAGKAVGVELNPEMVLESRENIRKKGMEDRIDVLEGDLMDVDLSPATVVLAYLVGAASKALRPKFEAELRVGTRVVMERFPVPGWQEERAVREEPREFYLYTMPPNITDDT
jgi:ribosomal protein L11 methylase PrmA